MEIIKHPLVSIIVATYNSSNFILETLESIRKQTYTNIELIITDDYSNDDTVILCEKWIKKNINRFTNVQIIKSPVNTGITSNINRGYTAAQGEWIKGIAGDDALEKDCISQFVSFVNKHSNACICFSKMNRYKNKFNINNLIEEKTKLPHCFTTLKPEPYKQFLYLCLRNCISAPTIFMKKELYNSVGGFDNKIRQCEDYPMWLKITQKGYPFYYLDESTILYRVHDKSLYGGYQIQNLFKSFFKEENATYQNYIKPYAPFAIRITNRYEYYIKLIIEKCNLNKNNPFAKILYRFLRIPLKILHVSIICFYKLK